MTCRVIRSRKSARSHAGKRAAEGTGRRDVGDARHGRQFQRRRPHDFPAAISLAASEHLFAATGDGRLLHLADDARSETQAAGNQTRQALASRSRTPQGVPFAAIGAAKNIAFTSLWDNWPRQVSVPVNKTGDAVWLLVCGFTPPMQGRIANAVLRFRYADGKDEKSWNSCRR